MDDGGLTGEGFGDEGGVADGDGVADDEDFLVLGAEGEGEGEQEEEPHELR
jgi:hypothetical protein